MTWTLIAQVLIGLVECMVALLILFFCIFGCIAVWDEMVRPKLNNRIAHEPARRAAQMEEERAIRKRQMRNLRVRLRRVEKALIDATQREKP